MKKIKLTQGKECLVDDDLYEWLNQWKWYYRKRTGGRSGGDVVRTLHGYDKDGHNKNRTLYMVDIINPMPPGFENDHEDTNPTNNQRGNLRKSTRSNNTLNTGPRKNNKTGIKGVYWHEAKQRYVAQITVKGKKKWLGDFKKTELDKAAKVSAAAIKKYHGKFARTE